MCSLGVLYGREMRVLRVNDLAAELDLLPGDMGVMLTLGQMVGLAQTIVVPDSTTLIEITGNKAGILSDNEREELRKALEAAIGAYLKNQDPVKVRTYEIVEICLSIIEKRPPIS